MRYSIHLVIVAAAMAAASCNNDETTFQYQPSFDSESLVVALTRGQPRPLQPGVDTIALQRLLGALPVESRPIVRAAFEDHPDRLYDLGSITGVPGSAAMIDAVTAPRRAAATPRSASSGGNVWDAPVTIVLVAGDTPDASRPMIKRRGGAGAGDLIVLREVDASVSQLSQALRTLAVLRRKHGVLKTEDRVTPLMFRSTIAVRQQEPGSWVAYLNMKLSEVRSKRATRVPGIGMARVLEIARLGH